MKMITRGQKRIAELIRQILNTLILREIQDPRLQLVSVADVEVSVDFCHARVYVHVLGSDPEVQDEAMEALRHAAGFFRSELAKRLRTRRVPELTFELDTSLDQGERIERLLAQIQQEQQSGSESSDDHPADP